MIATTSSDAKAEQLRALGASHVLNYRTSPDWGEEAKALMDEDSKQVESRWLSLAFRSPGALPCLLSRTMAGRVSHLTTTGCSHYLAGTSPANGTLHTLLRSHASIFPSPCSSAIFAEMLWFCRSHRSQVHAFNLLALTWR